MSEPVSCSLLSGFEENGFEENGFEEGFGVVVVRAGSARGMVLISRSWDRGRVLRSLGVACWGMGIGIFEDCGCEGGAGGGGLSPACLAFSSHAARVEGSIGQDDCSSSLAMWGWIGRRKKL